MASHRSLATIIADWFSIFHPGVGRVTPEAQVEIDAAWTPLSDGEIKPPWVAFPAYPLGDFFWRDAGEAWFGHLWTPFYQALSPEQQEEYLARWNVPGDWRKFYFDPEFRASIENTDE